MLVLCNIQHCKLDTVFSEFVGNQGEIKVFPVSKTVHLMGTQVFRSNVDCINYRINILLDMMGDITMHNILFLFSKYCRTGSHDRHQIKQEGNQQHKGYCLGAAMVFVE